MTEPQRRAHDADPVRPPDLGAAPSPDRRRPRVRLRDPYAVTAVLHPGPARSLDVRPRPAGDGLIAPAGRGDVAITPATDPSLVSSCSTPRTGPRSWKRPRRSWRPSSTHLPGCAAGEESAWFDFDDELAKLAVRD